MTLRKKLACTLVAALLLMAIGASAAGAATFDSTLSNPVSGTNTKQTIEVAAEGASNGLSEITITQPSQFNFNNPALGSQADRCPYTAMPNQSSTFDPSNCPAQAKVGTITVDVGSDTATGDIYLIERLPFAWLGVDISPTTAEGNPSDMTIRFAFMQSWPQVDPTCDPLFTPLGWCEQIMVLKTTNLGTSSIDSATITLGGPDRGDLPGDLFYVPTYATCDESYIVKGVVKETDDSVATTYDGDCPFAPTFGGTLSDTTAGELVDITWTWENEVGSSNIKTIGADADWRVAPNVAAYGSSADRCPTEAISLTQPFTFDPSNCPTQAKVGSFTLNSPDYSTPATGDIYLVERGLAVWLAAKLTTGDSSIVMVPSMVLVDPNCDPLYSLCLLSPRVVIWGLPNVRTTSAQMVLGGPDRQGVNETLSGKLFKLSSEDCSTPLETKVHFIPFLGSVHTATEYTEITGC